MRSTSRKSNTHVIRNTIFEYIKENLRSYLILIIIFFIGLLLGVVFINNINEVQSKQISEYISNFILFFNQITAVIDI